MAEVFAKGIEATVRHTGNAISSLKQNEGSLGEPAARLSLDKSATSSQLRDAIEATALTNLETPRWSGSARIVCGDSMPSIAGCFQNRTNWLPDRVLQCWGGHGL